jgi:CHAT domain-containing protein/tetratricopeptide (TPR) repeat protein
MMRTVTLVLILHCASLATTAQPATVNVAAAADPLVDVMPHLLSNRYSKAKEGIARARLYFRSEGDTIGLAWCDLLEGMAEYGAGRETEAIVLLETSQRSLAQVGDPFSATIATWSLVNVLEEEGELERAETAVRSSIEALEEAGRNPRSVRLDGFFRMGSYSGAPFAQLITEGPMVELAKPLLLTTFEAMLREALSGVLIEVGRLTEAEAELARVEATSHLLGGMFDSSIAMHRGDLLRRQWRLEPAKESYERGLSTLQPVPLPFQDSRLQTRVMAQLAAIEQLQGHRDEALAWNDKSLALARKDGDCRREASILEQRGDLLAQQGRADERSRSWQQALDTATECGDVYRQASIQSAMGLRYFQEGTYGQAAERLERAVVLYRSADEPGLASIDSSLLVEVYLLLGSGASAQQVLSTEVGSTFSCLEPIFGGFRALLAAAVALDNGDTSLDSVEKRADELLLSAPTKAGCFELDLWKELGESLRTEIAGLRFDRAHDDGSAVAALCKIEDRVGLPLCFWELFMEGRNAWMRADLKAAITAWKAALARANSSRQHDLAAGVSAALGAAYLRGGDLESAATHLRAASVGLEEVASTVGVGALLTSFLGSGRNVYHELFAEVLARQGKWREAFEVSERARSRGLALALRNPRLRPRDKADSALVSRVEGLSGTLREWERSLPLLPETERKARENDIVRARRDYEGLLVRLRVTNPEYASLVRGEPATVEEVQSSLDNEVSLVSYLVTPLGVHAWVIDREQFVGLTLPIASEDLGEIPCFAAEQRLPAQRRGLVVIDARPCSPGKDLARELYRRLITPLLPYLRHERVMLLPYGQLHSLPFAALRNPETGNYLVEERTLTLAPSASVIPFLRLKESAFGAKALVLGDPKSSDGQLPALRGARQEAKAIAKRFGTKPLLGSGATETRLRERAKGVDVLHLAAHARPDPKSPGFSRLALAGDRANDGFLEAHEISSDLDLEGVNLVVLSACETAIGARSGGDEVMSLARAFIYAGSPAVVATLWRVDDAATARLMEIFYDRLLLGSTPAAALRDAQLALARDPVTADPSYWSAFLLVGDPQAFWGEATDTNNQGVPTALPEDTYRRSFLPSPSSPL